MLRQPLANNPYGLLEELTEDELVQVTERPSLIGNPALAQQICRSFLSVSELSPQIARRDLIRDAVKRVRRLLPILAFDVMDDMLLQETVDQLFLDAAISLGQE